MSASAFSQHGATPAVNASATMRSDVTISGQPVAPHAEPDGASGNGRRLPRGERASRGQVEAQLRAHVVELEARLTEVTRCLETAENRASALLEMTARAEAAERMVAVLVDSSSWRVTRPLRWTMQRIRRPFGR